MSPIKNPRRVGNSLPTVCLWLALPVGNELPTLRALLKSPPQYGWLV